MTYFTAHTLRVHRLRGIVRFHASVDHEGGVLPGCVVVASLFAVEQLVFDPRRGHDVLAAVTAEVVVAVRLGAVGQLRVALDRAVSVVLHRLALVEQMTVEHRQIHIFDLCRLIV